MFEALPSARHPSLACACAAAAFLCSGCDAIPGTASYQEEKAKRAVAEQLIDPTTAQFRNMQVRGDSVCGEVNGKNKMGAYVGYSRFVVETTSYEALIDPQFDYSDLLTARDLCTQMSTNQYSSLSSTMSTCERVTELEAARGRQGDFDKAWTKSCSGGIVRQVYRPPLDDNPPSADENLSGLELDSGISADDADASTLSGSNPASHKVDEENSTVSGDAEFNTDDNLAVLDE